MSKKIYIATPYSDPDEKVRQRRFELVTFKVGKLMNQGYLVYSPITSCHPVAIRCLLPTEWKYWEKLDRSFIEWCDELWIYKLDGWKKSTGVNAEIKIATELGKPILYIELNHEYKYRTIQISRNTIPSRR